MGKLLNISKLDLIKKILDIEWDMFKCIRPINPADCQRHYNTFIEIRSSIFETWTEEMLNSYMRDLIMAKQKGRNLLMEKYAKMDGLLTSTSINPIIDKIVEIEEKWQKEIEQKYPALYYTVCRDTESTNNRNFSLYLKSELETYGDNTLKLYYHHVITAYEKGENLAIKSLYILVKRSGFTNLEHAESILKKNINNF